MNNAFGVKLPQGTRVRIEGLGPLDGSGTYVGFQLNWATPIGHQILFDKDNTLRTLCGRRRLNLLSILWTATPFVSQRKAVASFLVTGKGNGHVTVNFIPSPNGPKKVDITKGMTLGGLHQAIEQVLSVPALKQQLCPTDDYVPIEVSKWYLPLWRVGVYD
eukprot:SAG11_NODE_7872_length_1086_cov_0.885512_2_plen_160_part_01